METRVTLSFDEMPRSWYNILPDLPSPLPPPLHPGTRQPIGPQDLAPLFPMALIRQEVSSDRYIPIPEPLVDAYQLLGRPTPLQRAVRLEQALNTPAEIWYKREDLSPTGSHKTNTAFAQAYYNREEGVERLTTETGAGQWGSALAMATNAFGLKCLIFMVRVSYDQKPHRKHIMHLYGAEVHPSPSDQTNYGRKLLKEKPDHPGSLGLAISEAIEVAAGDEKTKYSLGSVLNHVLLHQTIIGQEVLEQFRRADRTPDAMIGCVGGGSNFAGFTFPAIHEHLKGKNATEFIAAEPKVVPSLTAGKYEYDFGDTGEMTPLVKMYTLGHNFVPAPIHAGGLRYHGAAPTVSLLVHEGIVKPVAFVQQDCFAAGELFARTEGIIPAPESAHALKAAIDLAVEAKRKGERKIIAFNLSGHGLLDLHGYGQYLDHTLAA